MHVDKPIDIELLAAELTAAGVPFNGLQVVGSESDGELTTFTIPAPGELSLPTELPPEAVPVVEAHDASKPKRTKAFEAAGDQERLALVNERAQTDPAFAALAELALRGVETP